MPTPAPGKTLMLLGIEIGLIIAGIVALVTGKAALNKARTVRGLKARLLGVLMVLVMPAAVAAGFAFGVYEAVMGRDPARPEMRTTYVLCDVVVVAVSLVVIFTLLGLWAEPTVVAEPRRSPRPRREEEPAPRTEPPAVPQAVKAEPPAETASSPKVADRPRHRREASPSGWSASAILAATLGAVVVMGGLWVAAIALVYPTLGEARRPEDRPPRRFADNDVPPRFDKGGPRPEDDIGHQKRAVAAALGVPLADRGRLPQGVVPKDPLRAGVEEGEGISWETFECVDACWSPDGKRFYLLDLAGTLSVMNADSGRETMRLAMGRKISYLRPTSEGPVVFPEGLGEMWLIASDGSEVRRRMTVVPSSPTTAVTSPLVHYPAFPKVGHDPKPFLVRHDVRDGSHEILTPPWGLNGLSSRSALNDAAQSADGRLWCLDEDRLVVLKTDAGVTTVIDSAPSRLRYPMSGRLTQIGGRHGEGGHTHFLPQVFLADDESAVCVPLAGRTFFQAARLDTTIVGFECPQQTNAVAYSPSLRRVYFGGFDVPFGVFDAAAGKTTTYRLGIKKFGGASRELPAVVRITPRPGKPTVVLHLSNSGVRLVEVPAKK